MQLIKKTSLAITLLMMGATQLQAAPQDEGSWTTLADWPLIAIHAVLTPQGNVMTFGYDGNSQLDYKYDVWDPEQGLSSSSHNTLPNTLGTDTFCSAAVIMPDTGNVLIAGGDSSPSGVRLLGVNDVAIYNSQSNAMTRAPSMSFARWYPTTTVLPNGEILVNGGKGTSGAITTPEVYSPSTNTWRSLFGISTVGYDYYYPREWVAPNGKVFGIEAGKKMYYLDPFAESLELVGNLSHLGQLVSSSAVMYQPGKILLVGGVNSTVDNTVTLIDINGSTPSVRGANPGSETGRAWVDSVVLPTGDVMIVGGSGGNNTTNDISVVPEIWNPASERWSQMAPTPSGTARLYHSTALLLKDGTILVAGGGLYTGLPFRNNNAEVFTPPYLYDSSGQLAPRPSITSAPSDAVYGNTIDVSHGSNDVITRVTLIKTGAVTHSNNMDQRFMELNFEDTNNGVRVALPSSANVAPPGYYLLHLLDDKGVPSKAHIIRITATTPTNVAPLANADNVSLSGSGSLTIDALANDAGSALILNAPNAWSLNGGNVVLSNNKLIYTPKGGYNGQDKIWYNMQDNYGRSSSGEITITVSDNNGEADVYPVAGADRVTVSGSGTVTIDALANDTGSGLTLNAPNAWSLRGGNVALSDNKLTYKPKADYNGEDKIWYSMIDNQGRSSYGEITITISGNSGGADVYPTASPDNVSVTGSGTITIDALANDSGSGLTLNAPNAWSLNGGNVALVSNKLTYKAKAAFNGTDKIWYSFADSQGRGNSGEITITVSGNSADIVNVYPTAGQDNVTARSGQNTTFDVLANDTGSGLTLNAPNAWSLSGGTVSLSDNKLVYKSKAGFTGSDNIWYVFTDSQGRGNTGQVNITVTN